MMSRLFHPFTLVAHPYTPYKLQSEPPACRYVFRTNVDFVY